MFLNIHRGPASLVQKFVHLVEYASHMSNLPASLPCTLTRIIDAAADGAPQAPTLTDDEILKQLEENFTCPITQVSKPFALDMHCNACYPSPAPSKSGPLQAKAECCTAVAHVCCAP